MQGSVFVDSNIFLYAFSDLDLDKQKIASRIVSQENCVISSQVLNEVSNNLLKKLSFKNSEISRFIESAYSRYWVSSVCKDTFLKACELRENYNFSYYDSLIVASASPP
jgi:predicted nucleic acid-binding protein